MRKESKTARASMNAGQAKAEKKVVSDADLIKNLRLEVANGLYPTSQGPHALLREFDKLLAESKAEIERTAVTWEQIDKLAQFLVTTFPNDCGEGTEWSVARVVDTAIQIFKDLLQANESISSLARKLAVDAESLAQDLTAEAEYFDGIAPIKTPLETLASLEDLPSGTGGKFVEWPEDEAGLAPESQGKDSIGA
jgi:hypothetical protein